MTSLRGMLVLIAASLSFGVMAFLVKIATADLAGAQVALIRFLVSIAPLLAIPRIRRSAMSVARFRPLLLRGLFGGAAVLLYFTAIQHIPVGIAALLNTTAPVFSGIFAAIFLGEKLRAQVLLPLSLTLTGIFLVARGHATPNELLGFGAWEATALASALCAAAAVTAMRGARRTESVWATIGALSIFGLVTTAPIAIIRWTPPTAGEWWLMIAAGGFGLVGQILMTWAYRWVETMIAGVISQFTVIVAMSLGVVFLHDELNALIVTGTSLTMAGVVAVISLSRKRSQDITLERPLPVE